MEIRDRKALSARVRGQGFQPESHGFWGGGGFTGFLPGEGGLQFCFVKATVPPKDVEGW